MDSKDFPAFIIYTLKRGSWATRQHSRCLSSGHNTLVKSGFPHLLSGSTKQILKGTQHPMPIIEATWSWGALHKSKSSRTPGQNSKILSPKTHDDKRRHDHKPSFQLCQQYSTLDDPGSMLDLNITGYCLPAGTVQPRQC